MLKVILEGYIIVPEAELDTVTHALPEHIRMTRAEPGCLLFQVAANPQQRGRFDVYEAFIDEQAFNTHQQRVHAPYWGQVTKHVERHYHISSSPHDQR